VTSESERCYKPEARIFEKALSLMNVRPERVLHVGDSLHSDVGGAGKLGITTVWLRRESRVHDIGMTTADHQVSKLTELRGLL
jgi:2-haloacid dehalogenase/putative hydrolase of the HAD superfamily